MCSDQALAAGAAAAREAKRAGFGASVQARFAVQSCLRAARKIGAIEEGTFRNHIINEDGTLRHTMYFSFISDEWPEIKSRIFGEFILP